MIWTKGLAKQLAQKGIRVNAGGAGTDLDPRCSLAAASFRTSCPCSAPRRRWAAPVNPQNSLPSTFCSRTNEVSYSTGQVYGAVGGHGGP